MKKKLALILSLSILLLIFNSCSPNSETPDSSESKDFDMFAEYVVTGGYPPEITHMPASINEIYRQDSIKKWNGFLVKVRVDDENSIVTVPNFEKMVHDNASPILTKLIKLKILDIYVFGEEYYYPLGLNEEIWFDMRCFVDEETKTMRNNVEVFIVPGEEFLMFITPGGLVLSDARMATYSGKIVMRTYPGGMIPLSMSDDEYIRLLMLNNFDRTHINGTKYDFEEYKQIYYDYYKEAHEYMKEIMENHNKKWHTNGQTSCGEMN